MIAKKSDGRSTTLQRLGRSFLAAVKSLAGEKGITSRQLIEESALKSSRVLRERFKSQEGK